MNKRKAYFSEISSKFNDGKIFKTTYNRVVAQISNNKDFSVVSLDGDHARNHEFLMNVIRATTIDIVNTLDYIRKSRSLIEVFNTIPDNVIKNALLSDKNIDLDKPHKLINLDVKSSRMYNEIRIRAFPSGYYKSIIFDPHIMYEIIAKITPILGYHGSNTFMGKYLAFNEYDALTHGTIPLHNSAKYKYVSRPFHYWSIRRDQTVYKPLGEYMTAKWMVYFEVFGYCVINGEITKASKAHMEKFKKAINNTRLNRSTVGYFTDKKKFVVTIGKSKTKLNDSFVPIIQYLCDKLQSLNLVQGITDNYNSSNDDTMIRSILSHFLPVHIRKEINRYYLSEELLSVVNKKSSNQHKTIQYIQQLIEDGAIIDTNTLPFFNFNGQSHVIRSINSGNVLIADFFINNYGDLFAKKDLTTPNIPHIFKKYFAVHNKLRNEVRGQTSR